MEQDFPPGPLAVYLHIPFCLSRCGYCSFFSAPFSIRAKNEYLRQLHSEIDLWFSEDPYLAQAATLYFGGGTPSLLNPEEINSLCGRFEIVPEAEITLEINPLQITPAYLAKLRETPINRLSIGVQSLDDSELAYLERRHRSAQIPDKIKLCREFGYGNLSLDLIYGLPGSSQDTLRRNLEQFIALNPEHLSAYLLTLDEESALGQKLRRSEAPELPGDTNLADQYAALRQTLLDAGYEHYEISNFCRPGRASRHNLTYWTGLPYLGLGASASGFLPPRRYANPASMEAYARQIEQGTVMPSAQVYDTDQLRKDYLMMGLRLTSGIDLAEYQARFDYGLAAEKHKEIAHLSQLGLLEVDETRLRLSPAAYFVSNSVIGELL